MYIFIDESGTHKHHGRSSIALVYLSIEHLEIFQKRVMEKEKHLGIKTFHWSHSSWPIKEQFITTLSKLDFIIKIALIKNPFYENEAYEYALGHLVDEKNIKTIIIDSKKDKFYERRIKKILRDKNIPVKKLRTANDESYPALRVADAIAGLVRYRDEHAGDNRINDMYKKITGKIVITLEQ